MLITFEGGDGSGKSTQAELLERRLSGEGHDVLLLREPGSTALGSYLRDWLKAQATESLSPVSELLLFVAARAQLISEVMGPALDRPDAVVICDRYMDSTIAYQGYGRGLDIDMVRSVNEVAIEGVVPDLTFLIDVPPGTALGRVDSRANASAEPEGMQRFEEESVAFHERVYRGYHELASQEPERWRLVYGDRPEDEIADEIRRLTGAALPSLAVQDSTENEDEPGDSPATGTDSQPTLF